MKIFGAIIVVILILVAVFAAVNWSILSRVTPLSFVFFRIEGPLGIILLGISGGFIALSVAYLLMFRTTWLIETRRLNRELQKQRELAEQAEASRLSGLRDLIESKSAEIHNVVKETGNLTVTRIEDSESKLVELVNESTNSLTAHIGYVDERVSRLLPADGESRDDDRDKKQ